MNEIKELLKSTKLTKTGKVIAEFIIDNVEEACFMTSTDIAMQLNVSESSVIRFSRALGFSGFMDFQRNLPSIKFTTMAKVHVILTGNYLPKLTSSIPNVLTKKPTCVVI